MIKYHFSAKTDVGLVRQANEDYLGDAQTPNGHVFVVCDGMGGHVGGARASQIAVNSILEFFAKEIHENMFTALDRSLQFANEQIFAVALNEPKMKGMGTTAVVLVIKGDNCFIGHVGDSRIYLKSNNKLNRITKDHSFVQNLVDKGVISDDEAENHPKKNQILKALGISPNIAPTIASEPILIKSSDVFLLCSDGLSGMINDRSMEMMIDVSNLDRSASVLIQAACDGGGHDNITVTLIGVTESPHSNSVFKNFNPITASNFQETHLFENGGNKKKVFNKKTLLFLSISLIFLSSFGIWFYLNINQDSKDDVTKDGSNDRKEIKNDENSQFDNSQDKEVQESTGKSVEEKNPKNKENVNKKEPKPTKTNGKTENDVKSEDHKKEGIEDKVGSKKEDQNTNPDNCEKELEYKVKSGDLLGKILEEIHKTCPKTTKDKIMEKNNLSDENKLKEGSLLKYVCNCN